MYDNIDFKLRLADVSGIDFLAETPLYFTVSGEHDFKGDRVVTGTLDNFRVSVSSRGMNISDGSLCKWYLGDNFQTLGRGDTQRAIEKLSDTLHLPVSDATVSRIDIAQNFIVKQPVQNYYNHLGEMKCSTRAPITNDTGICETLYYYQANGLLLLYDKVKEQKAKNQPIPELYQDRNVLRYEQRYKSRLPKEFGVERVTGAMLYDEAFYIEVVNRWRDSYKAIKKINDVSLNFEMMSTIKDLQRMGLLTLIETQGGELNVLSQIKEAQRAGTLTKKQAFDLRNAISDACKVKTGLTVQNDAILELDKKVNEAVRYYR